MRLLTVLACLAFAAIAMPSHAETVSLSLSLETGDSFRILTENSRKRMQQGNVVDDETYREEEKVEVLGREGNGYRLRLQQVSVDVGDMNEPKKAMIQRMSSIFVEHPVEIVTDEKGAPVSASGWKPALQAALDALRADAALGAVDPRLAQAVEQIMGQWVGWDDATAAAYFGRSLGLWANAQGLDMEVGATETSSTSAPGPFGGAVDYAVEKTLVSADDKTAVVTIHQEATKESIEKMLDSFLGKAQQLPAEARDKMRAQIEEKGLVVTFDQRFEVRRPDGLTTKASEKQEVQVGDLMQAVESKTVDFVYE